jgi:hypothetical protein
MVLSVAVTACATAVVVPLLLWGGSWAVPVATAVLGIAAAALVGIQRGAQAASAPIGLAAAILLCGVVPFTFVALTPDVRPGAWVGALLISIAAGVRLAWLLGDGAQRLVESMVWTFVYVFLGLAPMVQMRTGLAPGTAPPVDHRLDGTAMWLVAIGTAAFAGGVILGREARPGDRRDPGAGAVRPGRVLVLALAGLLFAGYFVLTIGPAALIGTRFGLNTASASAWGNQTVVAVVRTFAFVPLLVAFVALLVHLRHDDRQGWLVTGLLPVGVGAVLLTVANPIVNARYTSGTVYLSVLAALGLVATRPRFRAVVAGFVAALIFLFPVADAFRYTATGSTQNADPVTELTTGDFDAYAQVVNTVQYVGEHGVTHGYQALGPLVFWVPRNVWPAKPVDTGILIAESRGQAFTNLSAPLWAELFINGGWPVLVAGMFVFGLVVRRWDARIVASLRRARTPGLLGCILPFYLLILLRGSLLQGAAMLAGIVLCAWFVRDRAGTVAAEPQAAGAVPAHRVR